MVMSALNLNLLSVYRQKGQEIASLPGLLAQNPPRKAARGRENDRLVVYLTLSGNVPFSPAEYIQVTSKLAERFYHTSGSLTYALKSSVESLNSVLAERNMKTTGQGKYAIGMLVLAALRDSSLYIVQSGTTHAYCMGAEGVQHFHDLAMAGKGLGLSQNCRMYFAQVQVHPGDRLLFCAQHPPEWEAALSEERGAASLEATRRRLVAVTELNLNAVLIGVAEGEGEMRLVTVDSSAPAAVPAKPVQPVPTPIGASVTQTMPPTPPVAAPPASSVTAPPALSVVAPPASSVVAPPALSVAEQEPRDAEVKPSAPPEEPTFSEPAPEAQTGPSSASAIPPETLPDIHKVDAVVEDTPAAMQSEPVAPESQRRARPVRMERPQPQARIPAEPQIQTMERPASRRKSIFSRDEEEPEEISPWARKSALFLARAIGSTRAALQKSLEWMGKYAPRILPADTQVQVSSAWLAIIAVVIIPALVVTIAAVVYTEIGRPQERDHHYALAEQAYLRAMKTSDPTELRRILREGVLKSLDDADEAGETSKSIRLRREAQTALDSLERVVRLDYRPALDTPLSERLSITQMAASDTELYLLDDVTGSVLRAVWRSENFSLAEFSCKPGIYNGIQVGRLLDIIALPRSIDATLLAIDGSGNLLYCAPGEAPRAEALDPPDTKWKSIAAIDYSGGNLYVLDSAANAVWVYFGQPGAKFTGRPTFFFGEEIPRMAGSKAIAVNGDDLYILHEDGHLTTCVFSRISVSPTRCSDPAVFVDTRPGYRSGPNLSEAIFTQVVFTSPPDPAVVLLSSTTHAIYRFSPLSLELQNQVRALPGKNDPLPANEKITAMAFSPNKKVFIFIGGKVFFSQVDLP